MKKFTFYVRQLSLALSFVLFAGFTATAQTITSTYQGKLPDKYNQPTASYDLQFNLYDEVSGTHLPLNTTPIVLEDVQVTNGDFTVSLNFDNSFNTDADRFLEISVRPGASSGAFTVLRARQQITLEQSGQVTGKWKQQRQQSQEVPSELCAAIEALFYLERDETATGETGYLAPNTAQGWRARFDSDGLRIKTRAADAGKAHRWALRLRSYGYGERAVPVERAEVATAGNRIEYRRGSLVEWYVNERRGVEHGFTISEPLAVAGERVQGEPLSLRLAVEGDLRAELSADGQSIGFMDSAGQRELLYDKLVAFDARGHALPSRMRVEGNVVVLEVDDTGAPYPLMVDPLIQQQKLTASDAGAGDLFGISISLSGDTAIVGAYQDDNSGGANAGAAYIFTRSGGAWTQQQKLTASDAATGDFFGFSVSVNGDTAMIGSINDKNSSGVNAGSAYVFTRSGGVWTQQQRLQPSDVTLNDQFGYSVSLSGDTAVIGSDGDDDGGDSAGSAYVFIRSGGVWTQQQKLTASGGAAHSNFGLSVSLSNDTVIIGAWQESNAGGSAAGAAYVFTRSGGVWTQQQKLTASDPSTNAFFGNSVSVSGDTAIIGAPLNDGNDTDAGAAYVFTRTSGVWTQQQRLHASDFAADDYFGASISVSGDTAVVSASLDNNSGGVDAGSVYVFTRSGGVWTEQQRFQASDAAADDLFGNSISLSGDTVIVGDYQDNNSGGADAGSIYVFVPEATNVAPVVNAGPDQSATENVAFNLTASFTDADASDAHIATVNWGDGSPTVAATLTEPSYSNPGTVTASHTYPASGNYTVTVTVTDGANASGSDTLQVAVGPSLSASYIQNTTLQQANANFNISGNGVVGGNFSINGSLNANGSSLTNLNASNITAGTLANARLGIVPINKGGTGITSAGANGNFLRSNGADFTSSPLQIGDVPDLSTSYIRNQTGAAQSGDFNISGNGTADVFNAATQFNIGGNRVLSITGTRNIFAGNGAGLSNTTGTDNSFFGFQAGLNNTTGVSNSFVGLQAGKSNLSGYNNSFFGFQAGNSNTMGYNNSFFGVVAGWHNTTGTNNTMIGTNANPDSGTLSYATAIGADAKVSTSDTIVLGKVAGDNYYGVARPADTVLIPGDLNVLGIISGNISGSSFTNLNASNITNGTLADARLSTNVATLTGVQTFTGIKTFAGGVNGDGSGLTSLNASNITSGLLDNARLGVVGIANGGTGLTSAGANGNFLRSNGTSFTSSALTATDIPAGNANYIQNTTTQQINSNFNVSGNGVVGGNLSVNGVLNANGSGLTNLSATNITTGTLDNARLGAIPTANIADGAITAQKIANATVTAEKIGNNQVVKNLNGLTDNVSLAAGANVTITPAGNTLTISAAGGNFIQNAITQQPSSNFNISGDGTAANLTASSTLSGNIVNATMQFNIGGSRVLSIGGTDNIFAGSGAGYNNMEGSRNSFVGANAGYSNTTGNDNSFFGRYAGQGNTSGFQNSFFGRSAGVSNIGGNSNSFVGYATGYSNTTGNYNSFFGTYAGYNNTTGYSNSFFGINAGLYSTESTFNSFFGTYAGGNTTTGSSNSFFGTAAGNNNTTGYNNSFFGYGAGYNNMTGFYNTMIGINANVGANNLSYATAIGAEAIVSTNNTVVLGRSAGQETVLIPGKLQLNLLGTAGGSQLCRNASNQIATCSSSLRYKMNVAPFASGLNILQRLRPIRFQWKEGGMRDIGFGAEDVAAVEPLLVTYNDKGEVEGVKYDRISAVLVNAVKEQQTQIEAQESQLKEQQKQIEAQQQQLQQQQTLIERLKNLLCLQNPMADVCQLK
ncbi:MAG TPA: PKD domain-containing protein [Pyrinomonadaceae bacterium]|jgi:hypothetical protein